MKNLKYIIHSVEKRFPFEGYMTPCYRDYLDIGRTVLRYLPNGGRILDFGSGPCDKTAIVQELGYECFAYDDLQGDWHKTEGNKEKILSFAKESGIDFTLADGGALPFQKNSFEMIMMNSVLEHLHESPRDLINDLLELAKPEGLLFVSVPNAANIRKRISVLLGRTNYPDFDLYYWYPSAWRGHVREYVKDDLNKLAVNLNLEVLELLSTHRMLTRIPSAITPIYIATTYLFPGWRDSWMLVAKKRKNWVPKKSLQQNEIKKLLGRFTSYPY